MRQSTHLSINARLCGTPCELSQGAACVELEALEEMRADAHGLVHGGFVFGLADYAAMLAINEPNVVLGSADVRLHAPVRVGERLRASARLARIEGKKHVVEVEVLAMPGHTTPADASERRVLTGVCVCFVPSDHVLSSLGGESV